MDDLPVTTITITRSLTPHGDDITAVHVDGDNTLVTLLGLLELAKDTLIRDAMNDDTTDGQD